MAHASLASDPHARARRQVYPGENDAARIHALAMTQPIGSGDERYVLKLYVAGHTAKAATAIANLERICAQELEGRYEVQVIDVLEHPQLAEDDKILATPTLIKRLPPPLRRVIGDLSDTPRVLLGLEVHPDIKPPDSTRGQS